MSLAISLILLEIIILQPVFEQRVQEHRALFFPDEGDDLFLHQGILEPAHVGGGVQGIFPDDFRRAELGVAVDDGFQQADLESGQVAHHRDEAAAVDREYGLQGLQKDRFHNISLGQGVANGGEVVDVEKVALEKPARSADQVPVYDLSACKEALDDVLDYYPFIHLAEFEVRHPPVEEMAPYEYVRHRVDLRPEEYIGEVADPRCPHLVHHLLHHLEYLLAVLGQVEVLELLDDDEHLVRPAAGEPVRQSQHSPEVFVVQVPVRREYGVGVRKSLPVEDEMGAGEVGSDDLFVFVWSRCHQADHRGPEPPDEGLVGTDVQGGYVGGREFQARNPEPGHHLVHDGLLSCSVGLPDSDVLTLAQEVAKNRTVFFPADEMLAGDIFIVQKRAVHKNNIFVLTKLRKFSYLCTLLRKRRW